MDTYCDGGTMGSKMQTEHEQAFNPGGLLEEVTSI